MVLIYFVLLLSNMRNSKSKIKFLGINYYVGKNLKRHRIMEKYI